MRTTFIIANFLCIGLMVGLMLRFGADVMSCVTVSTNVGAIVALLMMRD